uniref:Uncharacterized protein n=1 Tax=Timema monikensis TaxID=170555 RepID=A0A7R9DWR1_9NEOP|nr:unnamed protein product [Timema monikensis]
MLARYNGYNRPRGVVVSAPGYEYRGTGQGVMDSSQNDEAPKDPGAKLPVHHQGYTEDLDDKELFFVTRVEEFTGVLGGSQHV